MPSKSKSQQRFFGMVDAYKKGELKHASKSIKDTADSMSMKDVKDFAETKHKGLPNKVKKHKKHTIKESELRAIIHNILKEEYDYGDEMNGYVNPIKKDAEMQSDWNDIDSWNSGFPTDGALDFKYQEGSDTYGKTPGVFYDKDEIDSAMDSSDSNINTHDEEGFRGMAAMDRHYSDKATRDKYPDTVKYSGRKARGEAHPYSDDNTNTFDDEIKKHNLNIQENKNTKKNKKMKIKESQLRKMIRESLMEYTTFDNNDSLLKDLNDIKAKMESKSILTLIGDIIEPNKAVDILFELAKIMDVNVLELLFMDIQPDSILNEIEQMLTSDELRKIVDSINNEQDEELYEGKVNPEDFMDDDEDVDYYPHKEKMQHKGPKKMKKD